MFKALPTPLTQLARGLFMGPGNQSGSVLNSSRPQVPLCNDNKPPGALNSL